MRVVIFSTEYIESSVIDLANSLSESVEVMLITSSDSFPKKYLSFLSENILVEIISMPRMRNPKSFFIIRKIVKKILSFNPDILHIQSNGHLWFLSAFDLLRKITVVNTIHDSRPHIGDKKSRGSFLLNKIGKLYTNRYVSHNEHQKHLLSHLHGISKSKIDVIPLAGHSIYSKISNKKFSEEKNTILFFGRVWPYKGLDLLINIEPLLSAKIPDVKIIVAGRGEDLDKYKEKIRDQSKFIFYNKFIDVEEVSSFFKKASLVVLPYKEATQSGIIPLSFSYTKTVVATAVGGLKEQFKNGVHGFFVPSKNEKLFASKILEILKNDKLRKSLELNAKHFYDTELSESVICKKVIKTYNAALGLGE